MLIATDFYKGNNHTIKVTLQTHYFQCIRDVKDATLRMTNSNKDCKILTKSVMKRNKYEP